MLFHVPVLDSIRQLPSTAARPAGHCRPIHGRFDRFSISVVSFFPHMPILRPAHPVPNDSRPHRLAPPIGESIHPITIPA